MKYIVKIESKKIGPLTGEQVLARFDSGEINTDTRITTIDYPLDLDLDDCQTLGQTKLYSSFDRLRNRGQGRSTIEHLQEILEIQKKQLIWIRIVGIFCLMVWILSELNTCSRM